jgi:glycosyltransferase involved in cell wall biosynthesis
VLFEAVFMRASAQEIGWLTYVEEAKLASVSVILPVYNAGPNIERVFDAVYEFARTRPDYHFLFVDDGSQDETATILQRCISQTGNGCVNLISYRQNGGKGYAIKTAFYQTQGENVLFTDGDLAYDLDHLPHLVEALKKHDVVAGSRSLIPHQGKSLPISRRILGRGFNLFVRLLLNLPFRDTQAGLKGFRRDAGERLFALLNVHDFSFDVELIYLAKNLGFSIGEIPARVSDEHDFKDSTLRLFRDPFSMLFSLLRIKLARTNGDLRISPRGKP